ncbi:MAG: hypothetical protein IPP13_11695 [Kouleothrix sp.]|nr:hypothetical protein [Kouleothrix sp.]
MGGSSHRLRLCTGRPGVVQLARIARIIQPSVPPATRLRNPVRHAQ